MLLVGTEMSLIAAVWLGKRLHPKSGGTVANVFSVPVSRFLFISIIC